MKAKIMMRSIADIKVYRRRKKLKDWFFTDLFSRYFSVESVRQLPKRIANTGKIVLQVFLILMINLQPALATTDHFRAGIQITRSSYRVGPGDVLSIKVYNQDDLEQKDILVREDGFASFNNVGEVEVAGKTLEEINADLKEKYSDLVLEPIVTVSISQTRPGTVYLAGAVKHPGMYQFSTRPDANGGGSKDDGQGRSKPRYDLHVSNILANAGGVELNADLSNVEIRKANGAGTLKVDLWKMLKEGAGEEDLLVQSGDGIYVPVLPSGNMSNMDYNLLLSSSVGPGTFPVRVIGEVNTPGVFGLSSESASLNTAIAQAGGYKPSANKKILAIRRFNADNSVSTLTVDPSKEDVALRPNDVVYVSEQGIYKAGRFMENISKVLSPFTAISGTILGFSFLGRR